MKHALSILDLVFINQGSNAKTALDNSVRAAQKAEDLGFNRIWVAEHHNMPGIGSAATSIVLSHLASHTKKIKIGAGGIMLPNHSPLVIAEQFGTLETLYPGRIELGLGRAPGTDQKTMRALRREPMGAQSFPDDVLELQQYFSKNAVHNLIQAFPGSGLKVPLWILGSSTFGAQLAAKFGLPYAFASHFAPSQLEEAVSIYRRYFTPSEQLDKPYVIIGANVIAADTDAEAKVLFTSIQQAFTNMTRNARGQFPKPIADIDSYWSPPEKAFASQMLECSVVGSKETVAKGLDDLFKKTKADEIMITSSIYDIEARLLSLEIIASL
jgi:luciferase family oxidoreductase group 1